MQRSENDGSLNPIRSDIAFLLKMRGKDLKRMEMIEDRLDAMMDFLDGSSRWNTKKLPDGSRPLAVKFKKVPLPAEPKEEEPR